MITAIMIGAGARGIGVYGDYAFNNPSKIKFVGVAEPDAERRMYFAMVHKLSESQIFESAEAILKQKKLADCCFICTQDTMHVGPSLRAMELGYHVFLEKPMAVTPEDCLKLVEKAKATGVKMMIAHVLRYTPFFAQIKEWLDQGEIGTLMTIQHNENVSYWHQAHSYVRGNWRNERQSSPMILAKSCHDLDLLNWFASGYPKQVSSFGLLSHFKTEHCPEDAPAYCLDGCPHEESCLYYAPRVYLNGPIWMKLPVSNDMSEAGLMKALKQGPYGRCVYQCDNDVVDHQVTIIEYDNEVTAAFTMTGFTNDNTRTIKLMGTKGEIRGHLEKNELELIHFGRDDKLTVSLGKATSEHGGGDKGIMDDFVDYTDNDIFKEKFSLDDSLTGHLLAFAAERSRRSAGTIDYRVYLESLEEVVIEKCAEAHYYDTLKLLETVFCENMAEEYPLLLGEENRERIFTARCNDQIRAALGYYPSTILIEDAQLRVASLGSVATAEAFRNRKLATRLLRSAEADMKANGISLAIISGYGGIYEHFGATRVGNILGYELTDKHDGGDTAIMNYQSKDFNDILALYATEKVRYQRSLSEFQKLLQGQLLPRKLERRHLEIIRSENVVVAYVFLIEKAAEDLVLISEMAGDRGQIARSLPVILKKYNKSRLQLPLDAHDPLVNLLDDYPHLLTDQHASFKVVDWELFFKQLTPYFVDKGNLVPVMDQDHFSGTYTFRIGSNRHVLKDIHEAHRLIFGPNRDLIAAIADEALREEVENLFPLPFVWTNNLNYQ